MGVIKVIAWGCILIGLIGLLCDRFTQLPVAAHHTIPFFLVGVAMEAVYKELKRIHDKLD